MQTAPVTASDGRPNSDDIYPKYVDYIARTISAGELGT